MVRVVVRLVKNPQCAIEPAKPYLGRSTYETGPFLTEHKELMNHKKSSVVAATDVTGLMEHDRSDPRFLNRV